MPNYRYNATDPAGKWVSGEFEAESHDSAVAQLGDKGMVVESLIEADEKTVSGELSRTELVELVEQLASLTKAGVPLPSGLRAAASEMVTPRLRGTLNDLASRIESGTKLEEALGSNGSSFPAELRGLILAGSRSGRLTDLLSEFVRSANLTAELRRMFWSTLIYPSLILIIVLIITRFICVVAIQACDTLLNDFGVTKPGSTQALVALARIIADYGTELTVLLVGLPLCSWVVIRFTNTPAKRRRIACGLPLIGPILRYCSLTEFCHRLAMLLEADLPLPLAFELAGSSVGDAEVAEACQEMGQAVSEGVPLATAVRLWNAIPAGLSQLFQWSEDRRSLPEALHLAGDMFEARARSQSSFARSVISTVLIFLILWSIAFAVAAIYLPMLILIMRLSG